MKVSLMTRPGFLVIACFWMLSSCCSFPYRVNTGQVPKSERVEVHVESAEIVSIDGKTVSVKKAVVPAHLVITKGPHDLVVNFWERTVFSRSSKKLRFDAKPGKKYYVKCRKVRAGKSSEKKSKNGKYLFKRKGSEYLEEGGYLYTYECCIKDKETNEKLKCK